MSGSVANENIPEVSAQWAHGIRLTAKLFGLNPSPEKIKSTSAWTRSIRIEKKLPLVAAAAGLNGKVINCSAIKLKQSDLPVVGLNPDGIICVIKSITQNQAELCGYAEDEYFEEQVDLNKLNEFISKPFLSLKPAKELNDGRIEEYYPKAPQNWFRQVMKEAKGPLFELGLASFFSSLLAIATSIFSMQVWDRVIPARSMDTLWVLTIGVGMALVLDLMLRAARTAISDHFGKRADLKLSSMLFTRMLDISSDKRPKNPGSLVAQLRDLEQLREMMTSTTLSVMLDLPFAFLFLFIIWMIGGWMVLVPIAAIPLMIIPSLIAQFPLAKLSRAGMGEAALRNSVLMESIYRADDIKALQSEQRFSNLWDQTNQTNAVIGTKQRFYRSLLSNWSQTVQQAAYAATLVAGAYGVISGNLSFGVLTACSTLTSRTIAPLGQLAAVLSVFQNARVGKSGLDGLMKLPADHDVDQTRYHRPEIKGHFQFENVVFAYDGNEKPAAVLPILNINPGDRIAMLGKAGAGKSTILRLLAGLSKPENGRILLDKTNLNLIDVGDLRRATGLLMQDSGLFHGTIRENLRIASPMASDEDMVKAMAVSCADELLLNQQHGLDLAVRENGVGLSGGQRQSLLLARVILRNPQIVLLDEPTASLDESTERKIVSNLNAWLGSRTLIVATHRYPILDMVNRIILVDGGRIAADGPKDEVIARLRSNG